MLREATIAAFKSGLRGELIEPGDASYNAARKVYNAMIDRKPRLIVRCADVADVIAAVKFGREHKLAVSVRGGGHNAAGSGVCDDGLVIDLSPIKNVRVDPKKRIVLVGGGALWGGRRSCNARIRSRGSNRRHLDNRRWWPDAWRRDRSSDAAIWPYH
jgi:hypothetical protein